ncbi:MAG: hypothetical protein WA317_03170 [Mycobacterium sp.]|uniref:hypothetical protein n=1 Tax=Mycobacterium sp. TaxID=1785 RepID=UPI003CC6B38B
MLLFTRLGGSYREAGTKRLPVDLSRHELMMTLQPVPDKVIENIADEIFSPLVRLNATEG